jgi:hypothetical protein
MGTLQTCSFTDQIRTMPAHLLLCFPSSHNFVKSFLALIQRCLPPSLVWNSIFSFEKLGNCRSFPAIFTNHLPCGKYLNSSPKFSMHTPYVLLTFPSLLLSFSYHFLPIFSTEFILLDMSSLKNGRRKLFSYADSLSMAYKHHPLLAISYRC